MLRTLLILSLIFSSCAHEPRHALIDRLMVPAASQKPLLCNRAYDEEKKDYAFECMDLRKPEDRMLLWKLKFICKIGKQMWAVDPADPVLVRNRFEKKDGGLFHSDKNVRIPSYLHIEADYDYMVGAAMKCFSQDRYSFDLM